MWLKWFSFFTDSGLCETRLFDQLLGIKIIVSVGNHCLSCNEILKVLLLVSFIYLWLIQIKKQCVILFTYTRFINTVLR